MAPEGACEAHTDKSLTGTFEAIGIYQFKATRSFLVEEKTGGAEFTDMSKDLTGDKPQSEKCRSHL